MSRLVHALWLAAARRGWAASPASTAARAARGTVDAQERRVPPVGPSSPPAALARSPRRPTPRQRLRLALLRRAPSSSTRWSPRMTGAETPSRRSRAASGPSAPVPVAPA
jgi:hypothetical protein